MELNRRDLNNWHGVTKENISRLLVPPTIIELVDSLEHKDTYWLVFDEEPGDKANGYQIVHDEREGSFGLALKPSANSQNPGVETKEIHLR